MWKWILQKMYMRVSVHYYTREATKQIAEIYNKIKYMLHNLGQ